MPDSSCPINLTLHMGFKDRVEHLLNDFLPKKGFETMAGADPGFSSLGAQKIIRAPTLGAKREVPYFTAGPGPVPLSGPWKLCGFRCSFLLSEPYFKTF